MTKSQIDEKAVAAEVEQLLKIKKEDKLIEQLAVRKKTIEAQPDLADEIAIKATYDVKTIGPLDGLKEFGRAVLGPVLS
jgi:hypothetical protein